MSTERSPALQPPRLRDDGDAHRPVGWVELFFDLVFVVVVAVLAADLEHHPEGDGLLRFTLLFVAIFWVWNGFTYYTERFESEGIEHRLFVLLGVIAVAGLAVWGRDGLGADYVGFAISYLVARGFNIVLWLRAGYYEPRFRPAALAFTTGWALAAVVMSLAAIVDGIPRLVLFGIALVLDIASPAVTTRLQSALPPISRDKFPERFGLFTLIVLGETVAGIIRAVADANEEQHGSLPLLTGIDAISGLLVGFGMWWVYFDFIARRPPLPRFAPALVWVYLHVGMLLSVVVVGAGISLAVADDPTEPLPDEHRLLLLPALGAVLVFIAALELTLDRDDVKPTHPLLSPGLKAALGLVLAVVGIAASGITPLAALAVCFTALAACAAYGLAVWYGRPGAESR